MTTIALPVLCTGELKRAWCYVIVKVDYNNVIITVNFAMSFVCMVVRWETRSLKISLIVETIIIDYFKCVGWLKVHQT